jgi:hypothetical protein
MTCFELSQATFEIDYSFIFARQNRLVIVDYFDARVEVEGRCWSVVRRPAHQASPCGIYLGWIGFRVVA